MQMIGGPQRSRDLLSYITFRAAGAFVTALLIAFFVGPAIIRRLQRMQMHQGVREGTPDSHASKGKTPTMGGFIILAALVAPVLLWARLTNPYVLLALFVTLWMGAIGFLDDYLKIKQKRAGEPNRGLIERYKLAGQVTCGIILGLILWRMPLNDLPGASTTLPFFKYLLVVPITNGIAWMYVPWVTFILTGVSNAVNLTDGLDGLSAGLVAIAVMTLGVFAYVLGRVDTSSYLLVFYLRGAGELTVFCAAVVGACIGFLWHNAHPAQVFMGDTGSLALGGAVGAIALLLKSEFLLVFVGAVFIAETMSVIIQRTVFKYHLRSQRRLGAKPEEARAYAQAHKVFMTAPIHHHFEKKGWAETQVVVRFWIIGVLCAILALSTLKLR